jgi:hypothetical protein
MTEEKRRQGRLNKAAGRRFEMSVRKDLESDGWIVCKWANNVENNKLIPAKHKFNPFTKVMSYGNGFPDFVCFKRIRTAGVGLSYDYEDKPLYEVIGVESKMGSYLDKNEKVKCLWLINNKVFNYILIASRNKYKRGKILYNRFK